jgi:formamidopyrimidine-DNA glycosylase
LPELPEVEIIVRNLHEIKNRKISRVEIVKESLLKGISKDDFSSQVSGQKITDISRKGKYIFIFLGDLVLISHLRMSGKYFLREISTNLDQINHLAVMFYFDDGSKLLFCDARNFATFHLQKSKDYKSLYPYKNIGSDLVNDSVDLDYLVSSFKIKKNAIKACLLEQSIISGIGNIYASEILFLVKIHPLTLTNSLSRVEIEQILNTSVMILKRSIDFGGTSVFDFVDPNAQKGLFQNELRVYGRDSKLCYICSEKIIKIYINKRSTFFCPRCQNSNI